MPGGVFLLNSPHPAGEVWDHLPREVQQQLVEKRLRFYVVDAYRVAEEAGLGRHISTVMQTCFFTLSGVLPREEAIARIKAASEKAYGKRGPDVVRRNWAAIDAALAHLEEVAVPEQVTARRARPPLVPDAAPDFVRRVTATMMAGKGDLLPVSAFPVDGTWPAGTSRWEKRNIAREIPVWDPALCIQCDKCALVCPHAAIRPKVIEPERLSGAPAGFLTMDSRIPEFRGYRYALQVAPEDCTGCGLCAAVCPAKDRANPAHRSLDMGSHGERLERERVNWEFFRSLPEADRARVSHDVRGVELLQPLFEFSGACAGCGETPYVKLLTQLFGDRALIANATGCSSIYGGNLPTTPYTTDASGRGPAWANSLFEDNAEFGFGLRLAVDAHTAHARHLLQGLAAQVGEDLAAEILAADQGSEAAIQAQRERVARLRERLAGVSGDEAERLSLLADYLVKKSVWLVGGDGWAYDIDFGGLDHVLASGRDVNVLVLDTEVYSNTGGQQSKATPLGAAAKFAAAGKTTRKKDLGLLAMAYGSVYVAHVALGAKDQQTVRAFQEAEAYPGPSLIIAYSHCIAHGYDLCDGLEHQKLAVESGVWPLYRFDPRRAEAGEPPLKLDSGPPKTPLADYTSLETRFTVVETQDPDRYARLMEEAQREVRERYSLYERLAAIGAAASVADPHRKPGE
jgi:pyruvate-ferredoxin/flavodoxin oxidoreductase